MQENDSRLHIAIIMDGNGRWARQRGLPRTAGHVEGARSVRVVVEGAAASPEIGALTLYAFSSDNWNRPKAEVRGLMRLLGDYLRKETPRCMENGVRLEVVGRRDRLPRRLAARIGDAERATREAGGSNLLLRLAIDYSARDVLVRAAELASARGLRSLDREGFRSLVAEAGAPGEAPAVGAGATANPTLGGRRSSSAPATTPDVDLLIRTGGEQRLSDFLLWECAYAELLFVPTLWPEVGARELESALEWYRSRERRFGRVLEEAS